LRKVVKMIRGPKGTRVYLTVLEDGKKLGGVPTLIDILRDEVKLTEQEAKMRIETVDGPEVAPPAPELQPLKLAVISVPSFYADFQGKNKGDKDYKSSTRDVTRLIEEAEAVGAAGVVLDLRGNGGGSLDEAISLAGLFFSQGPVVQVRTGDGRLRRRLDPDPSIAYGGPLVVVVDRLSASASEIVAAAIQDYGRGVIVGERQTHGKGTVQTVYHLDQRLRGSPVFQDRKPGSLKFTMAKFYRVNGGSTQLKGMMPDIVMASFTDHMELGEKYLPFVMPWDEIEPLAPAPGPDVRPFLEPLKIRSAKRLDQDDDYQELLGDIAAYEMRRARKTLPLDRDKREALQAEDKQWSDKLRQITSRRRSRGRPPRDGDEGDAADYMLREALSVAADLVMLQAGKELTPIFTVSTAARDDKEAVSEAAAGKSGK
jgi:carboxyl-terminal processing protease